MSVGATRSFIIATLGLIVLPCGGCPKGNGWAERHEAREDASVAVVMFAITPPPGSWEYGVITVTRLPETEREGPLGRPYRGSDASGYWFEYVIDTQPAMKVRAGQKAMWVYGASHPEKVCPLNPGDVEMLRGREWRERSVEEIIATLWSENSGSTTQWP